MNTPNFNTDQNETGSLKFSIVGITSPEFQNFSKTVINSISCATKNLFRLFFDAAGRAWKYIVRKNRESIEMHNQQIQSIDERYSRNWHHLRSML